MGAKTILTLLIALVSVVVLSAIVFLFTNDVALLNPKGIVAQKQFELLSYAVLLSLFVLIPVLSLTFIFAWKFREKNTDEEVPEITQNNRLELVWWLIPITVISLLALVTWQRTQELDPYKPIDSTQKPMTIQVVALRWKWLFIYPEQNIASINFVQFPARIPINFQLTSDEAPMNSFWIPQLGGQIYAMTGMKTQLNLMADESGEFAGSAAEISGSGFAGMRFVAKASSESDFDTWVESVRKSPQSLTASEYTKLVKPSENNVIAFYSSHENQFDTILEKYMLPYSTQMSHNSRLEYH